MKQKVYKDEDGNKNMIAPKVFNDKNSTEEDHIKAELFEDWGSLFRNVIFNWFHARRQKWKSTSVHSVNFHT